MPFKGKLHKTAILGCAVAIGLATSGGAQAATYSAVNQFSTSSNPNGVWSYLYSNTLLPDAETIPGVNYWWSGSGVPNSIYVGQAISVPVSDGTVQFGTTYLTMDPESQTVDVRFTAPSAGTYTIVGEFFGADNQTNCNPCAVHPVEITDTSGVIFGPDTISTYLQTYTFNLTVALTSGEQVNFIADTGSGGCSYCNLSTGLQATISSTPLPAALPLFAGGLGAMGLLGWRRKRKAAAIAA